MKSKRKRMAGGVLILLAAAAVVLFMPKRMAVSADHISEIEVFLGGTEELELSTKQEAELAERIAAASRRLVVKPSAHVSVNRTDYEIFLHIDDKLWMIVVGEECYAYQNASKVYRYDMTDGEGLYAAVTELFAEAEQSETEQDESDQPEITRTETGETEAPVVREGVPLSEEELNPYRELFGQYQTWYSQALTSLYASPEEIDLRELFYNGILNNPDRDNLTQEEEELLAPMWAEYSCRLDTTRIPAEKMDEVLNQYFGISLEETEGTGLDTFAYIQELNCYYNHCGDTNIMRADIHAGYLLEDGTIALYYDMPDYGSGNEKEYVVTVRPTEDILQIVSNLEAD